MGKTEACCDCAAIHDDVLEHVQEHIVPEDQRQSMAKLFKIFGDNTRCSIMEALNCHEMCVCDLAVLLDMTKSAISHQLKILPLGSLKIEIKDDGHVMMEGPSVHVLEGKLH